jgi:hypothetical protein
MIETILIVALVAGLVLLGPGLVAGTGVALGITATRLGSDYVPPPGVLAARESSRRKRAAFARRMVGR